MSDHTPGNSQCCGRVSSGSLGRTKACTRTGSLEYEGDHYCKTHHPPTAKAKDDARRKEWEEECERYKQARKQQADKTADRDRKAEEYDAMKAERGSLRAVNAELIKALEKSLDVLQKANEQPNGPINDTIWFSRFETLFDFMGAAIASARKQGEQG